MLTINPKTLPGKCLRAAIAVAGLILMAAGCSQPGATSADYPAPGEMRVVSTEPLSDGSSGAANLIANGNFSEWWAGAPVPTGFVPAPNGYSIIERVSNGQGGIACAQSWRKSDRKAGQPNRFYCEVPNIGPGKSFEFAVRAQSVEGCTATFDVYEVQAGEKYKGLVIGAPVVPEDATAPTWFRTPVTTQEGGRLVILSSTVDEAVPPGKIIWHEWSLTDAPGK